MKISVPKENVKEPRIPLVPATAEKLMKLGAEILVESGLGKACGYEDQAYSDVGATIIQERAKLLSEADMVLRLHKPDEADLKHLKKGTIHVSYLDPFNEPELIEALKAAEISAFSLEMIPRSSVAQKMDVLSSQANLAGYVSVLLGVEYLDKILPMMTTPAGTIKPAKVFIIGVGVAGLQAIATARRLGARVEAFDSREIGRASCRERV